MNLQVQPLKVLATRQVVRNRLDFTSYLNGTAKDELERLDRLEGQFKIHASKLTIEVLCDGETLLKSDDWVGFKACLENNAFVKFIEGKEEFSIVERKEGLRTWIISDVDNKKRDLLYHFTENPEQISGIWYDNDCFIQDGRLVTIHKGYEMYNGKMKCVLDSKEYITADNKGNIRRKLIWDNPNFNLLHAPLHITGRLPQPVHNLDVKITKEMLAIRVLDNAPSLLRKLFFTGNCKSYLNACAEFLLFYLLLPVLIAPLGCFFCFIILFGYLFAGLVCGFCLIFGFGYMFVSSLLSFLLTISSSFHPFPFDLLYDLLTYLFLSLIGLAPLVALLADILSKL